MYDILMLLCISALLRYDFPTIFNVSNTQGNYSTLSIKIIQHRTTKKRIKIIQNRSLTKHLKRRRGIKEAVYISP